MAETAGKRARALTERGVMFEGFRMLIGAIIALLVLIIIVSAIQYFRGEESRISMHRFYAGLETASSQPNGSTFAIKDVVFESGSAFSSDALEKIMGLKEDCALIDSAGSAFTSTSYLIEVNQRIKADVYIQCRTGGDPLSKNKSCPVHCTVSFGKDIEE
ncbi:MAG: hypothetical protein ABH854_00040 [Candidatus Diapherotrites archaeon]